MPQQWIRVFGLGICFAILGSVLSAGAATVTLKDGTVRRGDVIVREFDKIYLTMIVKGNNKIFQYTASKVESVSDTAPVILAQDTELKKEPKEDAAAVTLLTAGHELKVQKEGEKDGWIKVSAWGTNEGWIPKKLLTDLVVVEGEGDKARFVAPPKEADAKASGS